MNTKRKMIETLIGVLILLFLIIFASLRTTFGADYYWVGGPGNWSDLSHWANTSGGPGNTYIQVPQSTDDVYIDNNSGLASGQQITLDVAVFSYDFNIITGAGANIGLTGNQTLTVYGDVNINSGQATNVLGIGTLNFYTAIPDAGITKSIQLNANSIGNPNVIFDDPDVAARFEVSGMKLTDVFGNLICRQSSDTIVFVGGIDANAANIDLLIQSGGAVVIDGDVTGYANGYGVNGFAQVSVYTGFVKFKGNLNCKYLKYENGHAGHVMLRGGDNRIYGVNGVPTSGAKDTLDMEGADVTIIGYSTIDWSINNSNKMLLKAANSTLTLFPTTNTSGYIDTRLGSGHTYNKVVGNAKIYFRSNHSSSIDTLISNNGIISGSSLETVTIGNGVTPGYMEWKAANYSTTTNFDLSNNATFHIGGNCSASGGWVNMTNSNHNFLTGSSVTGDYARMEACTATGPAAPYNPGANSQSVGTTNIGWTLAPPTSRYLRWVGPIPSDILDEATFANWNDPANWADGSLFPAAGPGSPGGQCPPTMVDSVRFPDQSYVRIDKSLAATKTMIWEGRGELADKNSASLDSRYLEIFGSLEFSPEMILTYNGQVRFRTKESYPTITMNGKDIPYRVIFEGTSAISKWTLLDEFRATQYVPATGLNTSNFYLNKGHLDTDGQTVYTTRFRSTGSGARTLELDDTDWYIQDRGQYIWVANNNSNGLTINAGTSHIIFTNTYYISTSTGSNPRMRPGGGHTYYDVTFKAGQGMLHDDNANTTTWFHNVTFEKSGRVWLFGANKVFDFNVLEMGSVYPNYSALTQIHGDLTSSKLIADSALFHGNTTIGVNAEYHDRLKLYPDKTYSINRSTYTPLQTINSGGVLDGIGTCTKMITINNGAFTSPDPQTVTYTSITDNTVSSGNFTYANSLLSGTTTGWNGVSDIPRTLYWYDGALGASSGDWDDLLHWSQVSGALVPAGGNCPPTKVDTVIFDDGSFTGNDTVMINQTSIRQCADMRWVNTAVAKPVFTTSTGIHLWIYGSLEWSSNMVQDYNGAITFRSDNAGETVTSNGTAFKSKVVFNGSGSWTLQDDFLQTDFVEYGYGNSLRYWMVWLANDASLIANGHNMTMKNFYSYGVAGTTRYLDIENSVIEITYASNSKGSFYANANGTFNLDAVGSTIRFTSSTTANSRGLHDLSSGSKDYHNVEFTNGGGKIFAATNSSFNNIYFSKTGTIGYTSTSANYNNYDINRIEGDATINVYSEGNSIDTLIMNGFGNLYRNNNLNKYIYLAPGKTYRLGANKVQHLANQSELLAIGNGSSIITLNSLTPGTPAYIRKDSNQICVDYIYIRDLHAIGDGISTSTACVTPKCDTVLNDSYIPTKTISGRARFFAGSEANDQGNNAGWDFSPYPPIPTIDLPTPDKDVCSNELLTVTFEFEGVLPAYMTFDSIINGTNSFRLDTVLTTSGFGFGSEDLTGSGTAADPYVWTYITTMPPFDDTLEIEAVDISFDRCFIGDANVSGKVKFTRICWDPLPVELLHFYVTKEENTSLLRWETASETNNAYFNVQRSADGTNFYSIGKVEGAGNSTQNIAYSFVDGSPVTGKNYYRLQQVDFNGDNEISQTEIVNFDDLISFSIYPNPAKGNLTISHNISKADIIIYDLSGKVVYTQSNVGQQQTINIDVLSSGSYLVEIMNEITLEKNYKKLEIIE